MENKDAPSEVKMYCINLKHRKDRWNRFQVQPGFRKLREKYPFEKFNAVLGNELDIEGDSRISNRTKRNIRDKLRRDHEDLSTKGGVGCYLSHYTVWKQFLERDSEKYCLIFEDDAIVPAQFPPAFEAYFQDFKQRDVADLWFLYNPNTFYTLSKTGKDSYFDSTKSDGLWIKDVCSGFPCYLISKHTAKILVEKAFPIEMHVDLYRCLLRDMKKIRTAFHTRIYVSLFNESATDTDIHVTQDCKICDVQTNFYDKGYTMVNMPQLYFAAAAIIALWLLSQHMRK